MVSQAVPHVLMVKMLRAGASSRSIATTCLGVVGKVTVVVLPVVQVPPVMPRLYCDALIDDLKTPLAPLALNTIAIAGIDEKHA